MSGTQKPAAGFRFKSGTQRAPLPSTATVTSNSDRESSGGKRAGSATSIPSSVPVFDFSDVVNNALLSTSSGNVSNGARLRALVHAIAGSALATLRTTYADSEQAAIVDDAQLVLAALKTRTDAIAAEEDTPITGSSNAASEATATPAPNVLNAQNRTKREELLNTLQALEAEIKDWSQVESTYFTASNTTATSSADESLEENDEASAVSELLAKYSAAASIDGTVRQAVEDQLLHVDRIADALRTTGNTIQKATSAVTSVSLHVRDVAFAHMGGGAASSKSLLRSAIASGVVAPAASAVSDVGGDKHSIPVATTNAAAHISRIADDAANGVRTNSPHAVRSPAAIRSRSILLSGNKRDRTDVSNETKSLLSADVTPRIVSKIAGRTATATSTA